MELDVSQAAVSNHVAALRKELVDDLFTRTSAGIAFTPGGLRLATRAVELLGLQDQTRLEVRAASDGRRILRLAVSSLFGEIAAPGLIELFSERAKDLDVEMSVHAPADFAPLLAGRGADVTIGPAAAPGADLVADRFATTQLLRYQLVAVVAPTHRFAGKRLRHADAARATWYLGPSAVEAGGVAPGLLSGLAVPESKQRIFQSHAAALDEARGGRGIALAPAHRITNDLDSGRLLRLDVPGSLGEGTWSISMLADNRTSPAAGELARFASTPRAIQAMLSGSSANIGHFKPRVHVTLWS